MAKNVAVLVGAGSIGQVVLLTLVSVVLRVDPEMPTPKAMQPKLV